MWWTLLPPTPTSPSQMPRCDYALYVLTGSGTDCTRARTWIFSALFLSSTAHENYPQTRQHEQAHANRQDAELQQAVMTLIHVYSSSFVPCSLMRRNHSLVGHQAPAAYDSCVCCCCCRHVQQQGYWRSRIVSQSHGWHLHWQDHFMGTPDDPWG